MGKRKKKLLFIAAVGIFFVIWTVWGNKTLGTTHYTVTSSRVPAAFDHYKIAVVADLHYAAFGENNCGLLKLIEKENPDMIAITGDFVDSSNTDFAAAQNLIQSLIKIAPCYYVTGNHEAWLGEQYAEFENRLAEAGVVVLHDSVVELTKNQETIQIAGLDDPDFSNRDTSVQQSMIETKLNNLDLTDDYCILLSHRPETFQAYVNANIDLVCSGHAHGGQFRLPFIGGIIAPNQGLFPQFDAGIYSEDDTTMIVSRGIGNSVIPIRINNRPELVCIELSCEM